MADFKCGGLTLHYANENKDLIPRLPLCRALSVSMVRFFSSLVAASAAMATLASVHGAVVSHDSIAVWAEPAPADTTQALAIRFKPVLDIVNGCQPYPAVDSAGNTSGGLKNTGSSSGSCSDKTMAQVYSRSGSYNGAYAIMYAWYMPKDEPSPFLGHRHDWETAVVWLDSGNLASAKIVAIAASAHGGFKKSYPMDTKYIADGVAAKINYKSTWPVNHEMGFTTTTGAKQPLIQWEQLTTKAKNALESTDFGSAIVPFKSSNFQSNLASAYYK